MNSNYKQPLLSEMTAEKQSEYQSQTTTTIGFFSQVWLLTFKNLLITFKNPKNVIFLVITPFILSLFLFFLQSLAIDNGDKTIADPPVEVLPPFPRCTWSDECVSLQVSFVANNQSKTYSDYPWIDSVMAKVVNETGVDFVKRTTPITSFSTLQDYYSQLQGSPNRTQIGLLMCGDTSQVYGQDEITNFCGTPSKDFTYYLVVKKVNSMAVIFHALEEPFPIDTTASALKLAVDKAIINYNLQGLASPIDIAVQSGRFPLTHNRYIHNYDIVTAAGAFYYMVPALFVFLFLQSQIVRQKQYKLRQGLNIFGAKHSAYWVSWFIIAILYSLIASISSFLAGLAFSFGFFCDTPAYILILLMFFPFCMAMSMMGFMVSTLAPSTKAANAASYGIVLLAIVIESFTADNNILSLLFTQDASALVQFLKYFLILYPPFSYTKIFTNVTIFSGYHFDIDKRSWEPGPHPYDFNTFSEATSGKLFTGSNFNRYSDLASMGILYADAALFIILTWYFDHIISSNRGRGQPLLFPIYKLINLCRKSEKKTKSSKLIIKTKPIGEEEESAVRQKNRVYQNSDRNIPALGLRIKCLNKTFKGTCSKQQVYALNELTMEIEPGQLMGILGHNGAGKTTLINILTGVISPDESEETQIIINRFSITKIDQIRKFIGLCAQFDILWQELTAYQHLNLFASLKGIPKQEVKNSIQELLDLVGLKKQTHNIVKGFSGGMKRRLSLAMAAIGNPKIILLDEPTTGLDPKVRQQVWQLIGKLKQNRSIILTTHSMEEADVLADRVCVMVKGKVRCIGSSLFLKQLYGKGHRLTLNIDKEAYAVVQKSLTKICPSSQIIDFKGGNIMVGIQDFDSLIRLIKILESNQPQGLQEYQLKNAIRDWAVSHATLEEVFMAVSRQKQQ